MTASKIHVFIGFDEAQSEAYETCLYSIRKHSDPSTVHVHPFKHRTLRDLGLFSRPWLVGADGNWIDAKDGKPFSTTFSHSRFLTPAYYRHLGLQHEDENRWAIFVDSDFVFLEGVESLIEEIAENSKPLSVVKHRYSPSEVTKMDNREQSSYTYKLWSSLMVFDMWQWFDHAELIDINNDPGSYLHAFEWYPGGPSNIGSISEAWNFIPGHSDDTQRKGMSGSSCLTPLAIHYTNGTPLTVPNIPLGHLFNQYYQESLLERAKGIGNG